jgi:hypothetical protein
LNYRLQQFRAPLSPQADAEVVGLLDELAARSRRHLHELERAEIGKEIADPWQHVQKNWPSDGSIPVPDSVQQALTQCRLHDPQGWMEDWAALQERLDVHQGQYYVHKALSALQSNPDAWEQTRDDLVQALRCDPDSWPALAPAFGLTGGDGGLRETDDANPPSALRPPPLTVDHAGWLLERAFQRIGADAGKCVRLWQAVERTLAPALAGGDVEALAQARILAERCRGYWPVGVPEAPGCADPRHPVNRFLEAWEKARGLVEAQRLLEAQPPQLDQAEKCLVDLLRSGLDTRGQLQRVVTELYLVRFHEKDAPPVQRSVLAGLEDWVRTVPQEQVPQMREQEIVEETERVRMMVAEQSELMPYRERPDEPATNKMKYL